MRFSDYFDKVYLINLLEREDRKNFIINELKSLGIYDELIETNKLEIVEAIKLPWITENIVKAFADNGTGNLYSCGSHNVGLYNCTCEHYKVMKKSMIKGYNRILILEDDACFLKDINAIIKALDTMPENFDILHLEGFYWPDGNYPTWEDARGFLADTPATARWEPSTTMALWATGGLIYSRQGMEKYMKKQEEFLTGVDYYTCQMRENCYFYTYPLIRQENKSETTSDIATYTDGYEVNNVYLSKCNKDEYYHMKDFKI